MEQRRKDQVLVKIEIEVPQGRQAEIRLLVAAWLSGTPAASGPAAGACAALESTHPRIETDLGGHCYADAARLLSTAPDVSFALKRRVAEDENRDPLDALADAQAHHALQALRVREALGWAL